MRGFVEQHEVSLRFQPASVAQEPIRGGHRLVLLLQLAILASLALWSWHRTVAAGEEDPPARAARLSHLQGAVALLPAGESEWVGATGNRPITSGDHLWAGAAARAELSTGAATVRFEAGTALGVVHLGDDILQLQLTCGELTLRVRWLAPGERIEVDTPSQAFSVLAAGSYRVEVSEDGASTLVTVRAGAGEAYGGGETYPVHAGLTARFTGGGRLEATSVQLRPVDELELWGARRDRRSAESPSARHVARDLVGYEELDEGGTWRSVPGLGDVWLPRTPPGWAPYHDGRWAWIAPWGFTWIDDAAWGYATSHYGRWISVGSSWGWVPGPVAAAAVYAPAQVAFLRAPAPGMGAPAGTDGAVAEVGWFALGPHEVYVPGSRTSLGYVQRINASNTTVDDATVGDVYDTQTNHPSRATTVTYVNRTAYGGVTFVPALALAGGEPVASAAVRMQLWRCVGYPVAGNAGTAPISSAVLGATPGGHAPRPPAAVLRRAVVTRAAPPSPPVPFARQQPALEAHPGLPLRNEELLHGAPAPVTAPAPLPPVPDGPARAGAARTAAKDPRSPTLTSRARRAARLRAPSPFLAGAAER